EARVAMECRVTQIVPVQETRYTLVIGQVICFHIREDLLQEDGTVDPNKLRPVGRLGAAGYAYLGEIIDLPRPVID
ncbi:MAG: flavin reductase family protein, partial [Chloroflexi bacterium]|nr:flavin reductase family protein [Chloroflexota bacterium]